MEILPCLVRLGQASHPHISPFAPLSLFFSSSQRFATVVGIHLKAIVSLFREFLHCPCCLRCHVKWLWCWPTDLKPLICFTRPPASQHESQVAKEARSASQAQEKKDQGPLVSRPLRLSPAAQRAHVLAASKQPGRRPSMPIVSPSSTSDSITPMPLSQHGLACASLCSARDAHLHHLAMSHAHRVGNQ